MASSLAEVDGAAGCGEPSIAIGRHPGSNVLAEIDSLLVWLPPSSASSILLNQFLGLGNRDAQHALARDVVPVTRYVLTLLIGMDTGRKAVDLPKAVVAGTPRAMESPAIELAQWA